MDGQLDVHLLPDVPLDVVDQVVGVQRVHLGLRDHPGRPFLELPVEGGEDIDRPLRHTCLRHPLLRLLQARHETSPRCQRP